MSTLNSLRPSYLRYLLHSSRTLSGSFMQSRLNGLNILFRSLRASLRYLVEYSPVAAEPFAMFAAFSSPSHRKKPSDPSSFHAAAARLPTRGRPYAERTNNTRGQQRTVRP